MRGVKRERVDREQREKNGEGEKVEREQREESGEREKVRVLVGLLHIDTTPMLIQHISNMIFFPSL